MSIKDATHIASAEAASATPSVKRVAKTLSNIVLIKTINQFRRKFYKCYFAKSFDQLPNDDVLDLEPEILAHYSGPDDGISDISMYSYRRATAANAAAATAGQSKPPEPTEAVKKSAPASGPSSAAESVNPPPKPAVQTPTSAPPPSEPPPPPATGAEEARGAKSAPTKESVAVSDCWDSFARSNIKKWDVYHHRSYGIATSLYESNLVSGTTVGDPIADSYAILTRRNSSILILADGVNWGPRSRLASRCAVRACMNYINNHLFFPNYVQSSAPLDGIPVNRSKSLCTHDVFRILMRSFDAAQELILRKKGSMTTLCCSVLVKLRSASGIWAVCSLSIGDSTAYVFNRDRGVFELTFGARNLDSDRDMRNVGGALGHVYGLKPDVTNLNYSVMYIRDGDIVFLVSDGISDNFDPVVSQSAQRKTANTNENEAPTSEDATLSSKPATGAKLNRSASQSHKSLNKNRAERQSIPSSPNSTLSAKLAQSHDDQNVNLSSLPEMSPYERYVCSLAHMNEVLLRNRTLNETLSAQETCAILIEHVLKLTATKRDVLERGLLEASKIANEAERTEFQTKLREKVLKMRGKLDHASIVAHEVGAF